jgi:hypothetical protein
VLLTPASQQSLQEPAAAAAAKAAAQHPTSVQSHRRTSRCGPARSAVYRSQCHRCSAAQGADCTRRCPTAVKSVSPHTGLTIERPASDHGGLLLLLSNRPQTVDESPAGGCRHPEGGGLLCQLEQGTSAPAACISLVTLLCTIRTSSPLTPQLRFIVGSKRRNPDRWIPLQGLVQHR